MHRLRTPGFRRLLDRAAVAHQSTSAYDSGLEDPSGPALRHQVDCTQPGSAWTAPVRLHQQNQAPACWGKRLGPLSAGSPHATHRGQHGLGANDVVDPQRRNLRGRPRSSCTAVALPCTATGPPVSVVISKLGARHAGHVITYLAGSTVPACALCTLAAGRHVRASGCG